MFGYTSRTTIGNYKGLESDDGEDDEDENVDSDGEDELYDELLNVDNNDHNDEEDIKFNKIKFRFNKNCW